VLVQMERIAPMGKTGSTQLCIIVNRDHVWRGAGKGGREHVCSEPGHMDMRETLWSPTVMEPRFVAPPVAKAEPAESDDASVTEIAPDPDTNRGPNRVRWDLFRDR
jgi:hypothetical protein